jgi:hypothetical protein
MVEYGHGVGQATGVAGGAGGGSTDVGAQAAGLVTDLADQLAALPPEGLLLLVVVIFAGLIFLRRAF